MTRLLPTILNVGGASCAIVSPRCRRVGFSWHNGRPSRRSALGLQRTFDEVPLYGGGGGGHILVMEQRRGSLSRSRLVDRAHRGQVCLRQGEGPSLVVAQGQVGALLWYSGRGTSEAVLDTASKLQHLVRRQASLVPFLVNEDTFYSSKEISSSSQYSLQSILATRLYCSIAIISR